MSETRVALVKPGDVLLIGNVGDIPVEDLNDLHDALGSLKRASTSPGPPRSQPRARRRSDE